MSMLPHIPLVSIGVPVYNGGKYLAECLNSIQRQSYTNWECIIIDNASTDNTNTVASEFAANDSRFRLFLNPDFVDQTSNWNISFKQISSDAKYFKIVCADDWIYPEHVEKMVNLMEAHESVGICSSYRIVGHNPGCFGLDPYCGPVFNGKLVLKESLQRKYEIAGLPTTLLYRIDKLKQVPGYPDIYEHGAYHIDTGLAFNILSISDLGFIFQVTSYTRKHLDTYTTKITDRYGTHFYFFEKETLKYLHLFPDLRGLYREARRAYGWVILKMYLKGDKKGISWHKQFLDKHRYFTLSEFVKIFLIKIFHKIVGK